jgi:tetratricopeptide (TPR) repeat protein
MPRTGARHIRRPKADHSFTPTPATSRGRAGAVRPLLVVLAALVAYSGTFTAPFLFDDAGILDTDALHALSWSTVTGTSRPLVQLSFALNWAAGGANVVGYHVVNLVVHALAGLALYGIAGGTLRLAGLRDDAALPIALLWTVHPLQTESVTYVVQRAESMMGLCYLLTLYCVIRGAAARGGGWYGGAVVACALGMLCKPGMATAPLAVWLYDRAFLAGSFRAAWQARRSTYAGLFATWSILVVLLVSQEHESAATAGFAMRDVSFAEFAGSQPGVILRYLFLVVWPHGLVLDYGWRPAEGFGEIVLPALVLAAGVGGALVAFRGRPRLAFLVLAFLLTLLPSSSVIPIRDLAFEHRMYLPLAPLVALLVLGAASAIARLDLGPARTRRLATIATAVVVTALGALTIVRNRDYRSPIAMWTDVTEKRPHNARAFTNLAQAYLAELRTDQALAAARTAIALDPNGPDAHVHVGHALAIHGRYADAEAAYTEALRLRPGHAEALNNWGVLLAEQGRWAEADARYAEALRTRPFYAEAMNNRGVALMELGRHDGAVAHFRDALRISPSYAEAYSNLGNLFLRRQRPLEAIAEYRRALALRPDLPEVHFNLTLALASAGQREAAEAHAREAIRLRPDLAPMVHRVLQASSG